MPKTVVETLIIEHFGVHQKKYGTQPCAYEQFISSCSLYLSTFFSYISTYSVTTTTNVKKMFSSTLVLKPEFQNALV